LIRRLSCGAAALLALAACTAAAPPPPPADLSMAQPVATRLTGYLRPGDLDGKAILGPPPAADSAQGKADRAIYEQTRALDGSARWALAQRDNDLWTGGAMHRFSCALGREIGEAATPVTQRLLHRVELDVRTVGTPPKDFYDRKRPPLGDTRPICVPREKWMETNASYPSGHSMAGWSWALILAEIQPATASDLMVAGREIGQSRVVCGVHFASDVAAGRELAAAMVARLHADPQFVADLKAAKAELAAAPSTPPGSCEAYR
jgi:acid phosphatase (class A)